MRAEFLLRYFGRFHLLLSGLFLVPLFVGLAYGDWTQLGPRAIWSWLLPSFALFGGGAWLSIAARRRERESTGGLRRREGFLVVAFTWILVIIYGALPFLLASSIDDISSAIFESASGFTTTGATVLTSIESQPKSILFWRSFSHWLGGMGIIVLSIAILPELAVGGMQLFSAESSGLGVEKLAPRIAQTAKKLWVLYAAFTVVEVVFLILLDMSVFEAVNHALATTATGGFSPLNSSIGSYADPSSEHFHPNAVWFEAVITAFMFLAGINFALQYRVLVRGELRAAWRSSELRLYLVICIIVTGLIMADLLLASYGEAGKCFRDSCFQVVAISTTTGFGTADFELWPTFSKILIVTLMTIGGCAGSTAGGLKVIRVVVVFKHAARECRRLLYPKMVRPVTVDGKAIDDEVLWGVLGFFTMYMMAFLFTTVLLCALPHDPVPLDQIARFPEAAQSPNGIDLTTATTASLSALNSIGPGLGRVGPVENFAFVHPFGKIALSFCMLLGRLEIYSLLILFLPSFWSRRG